MMNKIQMDMHVQDYRYMYDLLCLFTYKLYFNLKLRIIRNEHDIVTNVIVHTAHDMYVHVHVNI